MMPTIFILVERIDGGWSATARDECGTLTTVSSNLRSEAVKRAQIQADRLMGTACRFTVQDLDGGEG